MTSRFLQSLLRFEPTFILYLVAAICYLGPSLRPIDVHAQSYSQTSRSFVPSPGALAMGDAGVALPRAETVFFYNPAHLSGSAGPRPRFTILGIRASLSNNFFDQLSFFESDLMPAIDDGLETLGTGDRRELYDETLALGSRRTDVTGDVLLPSVIAKVNGIGFGAGVFGHSSLHYRFQNAGAGVPYIDFTAMGDVVFVGSASVDLDRIGVDGLAAGISGKITNRWLTLKNKPLDAIGSDEDMLVLKAAAVGVDIGATYEIGFISMPGDLTIAAVGYDVMGTGFDYQYSTTMGGGDEPSATLIAEEVDLANTLYALQPSYRIGAAYALEESLPALFKNTAVVVDYLWYARPNTPQETLAHLHLGAQAQVGYVILRGGLNAGYTTFGGGIRLGPVALDYAFYGVEQGRFPGQLGSWNHSAQIAFGL